MKLIVAEKPSVARNITEAIKSKGLQSEYMVTACAGHLCGLQMPGDYDDSLKKWSLNSLPIIPETFRYKVIENKYKLFNDVKNLMNDPRVTEIINACDGDREGELIFRLVYDLAHCRKPVVRLWVSSQEPQAILEGMKTMKPMSEYDTLASAARCREIADWVVGINLTRLFTLALHASQKVTIGRVQTPTVQMVCEREKEIQTFVPKDYWNIVADLGDFKVARRSDVRDEADRIARSAPGSIAKITEVKKQDKFDRPPKLYDLTSLQQDCNKMFGMSAADTLATLQSLYEEKLATYPRTGSRYITSKDCYLAQDVMSNALSNASIIPVGTKAAASLKLQSVVDDKKVDGHPALLPTVSGVKEFNNLSGKKRQVLGLILYRLLEATAIPRKYLSTKITAIIDGLPFTATGSVDINIGWREIEAIKKKVIPIGKVQETDKKDKDVDEDQNLPNVSVGNEFTVRTVNKTAKKTSPPSRYTEASLLNAMENCGKSFDDEALKEAMKDRGLGTPATRAGIIEKIVWTDSNMSGYITRGKKNGQKWTDTKHLYPTQSAMNLMGLLPDMIKAPETTGEWEHTLSNIQLGSAVPRSFLDDISNFVSELVQECLSHPFTEEQCKAIGVTAAANRGAVLCNCPICGSEVVAYSVSKDKEGNKFPKPKTGYRCLTKGCFITSDIICGKKLSPTQVKKMLTSGSTGLVDGFESKKTGKKFAAAVVMERDENGRLTGKCKFELPEAKVVCKCPICGDDVKEFRFTKVEQGTRKKITYQGWACANKERKCSLNAFYNPYYGRTFSEAEFVELLRSGELRGLSDFVSRNGEKNEARVWMVRDPDNKNRLTGKYAIEWTGENISVCDCPVCGKGKIKKWRSKSGYSGYKCDNEQCSMAPLFNGMCQHDFTPEEVYELFTTGHTNTITDFISKKGKRFSAKVQCTYDENGKINGKKYQLVFS